MMCVFFIDREEIELRNYVNENWSESKFGFHVEDGSPRRGG